MILLVALFNGSAGHSRELCQRWSWRSAWLTCFQSWIRQGRPARLVCPRWTLWRLLRRRYARHQLVPSQRSILPSLWWTQPPLASSQHSRSCRCSRPREARTPARCSPSSECSRPSRPRATQQELVHSFHLLCPLWSHRGSIECRGYSPRLGGPFAQLSLTSHRAFVGAPSGQSSRDAPDSLWYGPQRPHLCKHLRRRSCSSELRAWFQGSRWPKRGTSAGIRVAP